MSQTNWEADKMLDVYIYDYLKKRRLHATAKAFQDEAKVSMDPVAIDAPGGFLFEWWSVFWDIFIARTSEKHSDAAASYLEARELHQQKPQQLQQIQMQQQQQQQQQQQFLMMRQQQRRDGTQLLNGDPNVFVGNDLRMRQNPATANALATKMYEERLKSPLQRDVYDDAATKQRLGDNAQLMDPNQSALLKAAAVGGQSPGQILHGTPGGISGNLRQVQSRSQQVPAVSVSTQEMKGGMMNPKATGPEGLLIGIHGTNQVSNNVTLKGWPLTGLDHLRSGLHQQPNSLMQSPQLQQQLLLQAQNLASPVPDDFESRRLRMLLNSRSNMRFGKEGQFNLAGDAPAQLGSPLLPHADSDMLIKSQQQQSQNNSQQQQYSQHARSSQHPQDSNNHLQQQDKLIGSGSITADGSVSNPLHGNDQPSKGQIGRKRKQPVSSSGHANSSGTANTTGPSHSSPSTASTHTPGDAMSMPTLPHNAGSSKSLLMYSSDGLGPLATTSNQLAEIDGFVDDGSLDDNVESYLSHDDAEPRDGVNRFADVKKGLTFSEVRHIPASTNKVECCHFSADGKLLATGAHDRKAVLWCTESFTAKSTLEEHSQRITDVRFSPSMSRLATSSADKTVRIWDVDNPGYSLRNFTGHSATVTSLDFHPSKEDLICSCDNNSEIRYWSIKNGSCAGVFKGGATHVRFQPGVGRILAAAADNFVSILDVETQVCMIKLQGHKGVVHSVCWDSSGEYLASVSNDLVKVWKFGSTSKGECVNELSCTGNKFNTCAFHPAYPSLLVIGCYETLEIWNMAENQTMTVTAHDKLVSSLAVSNITGLIASTSHDKCVKLWK